MDDLRYDHSFPTFEPLGFHHTCPICGGKMVYSSEHEGLVCMACKVILDIDDVLPVYLTELGEIYLEIGGIDG